MDEKRNITYLEKADAINNCSILGELFIFFFEQIYDSKGNVSQNIYRMQTIYNNVNNIQLKGGKKLLFSNLMDWFFTACANPDDFMEEPSEDKIEAYDNLIRALANKDTSVLDALKKVVPNINWEEESLKEKFNVNIEVFVESIIDEDIVSGNKEDKYDDQTIEDWYDFASNVEGLIEKNGAIVNIFENKQSLSQHIDFYVKNGKGNYLSGLIDLRLSGHKSITNARKLRKRKDQKHDPNFSLVSVIVNKKQFDSYEDALVYIDNLLDNISKNQVGSNLNQKTNDVLSEGKELNESKHVIVDGVDITAIVNDLYENHSCLMEKLRTSTNSVEKQEPEVEDIKQLSDKIYTELNK